MSSATDKVIKDLVEAVNKSDSSEDWLWGRNDWIAFVTAYLGRAADGVRRNERENQDYRENLVKAGGLIISALVAYDATLEIDEEPATE